MPEVNADIPPLGLIAGEGIFPFLVAQGARAAGRKVVCVALNGYAWPQLKDECDAFTWVGILRLNQWIRFLRNAGCTETIMVGRVVKAEMYHRWRWFRYIPDLRTVRMYFKELHRDKRDRALLGAVTRELASEGIILIDSTQYTPDHMASHGVMTQRQPTDKQWADIHFGWELCRTISRMDIGQSVAVIDKNIIAVEAIEGTNAMIQRAGELCRNGSWTLIKLSNGTQDRRFDVPTVGVTTIEKLHAAGAGCLVLEPGGTILLERPKVLEAADRYKIAVVGYSGGK